MMENLLTIDNGNTTSSVGIFKNGLEEVVLLGELKESQKKIVSYVISSQVGAGFKPWKGPKFISIKELVNNKKLFEMNINYSETIGEDRLAGALWAYKKWIQTRKAQRIMLVDSGTFTTIDLITKNGLSGGHIFPGTQTLLDTFKKGANLPELNLKELRGTTAPDIIPSSTADAIYASVQLAEAGLFGKWREQFRPDLIISTGGLAQYHEKYLPTEAIFERDVVHLGLYEAYKDMLR